MKKRRIVSFLTALLLMISTLSISFGESTSIGDISRTISPTTMKIGDMTTLSYNLNFSNISSNVNNSAKKEVVILVDISGSMSNSIGGKSKLDISKKVIGDFINSISSDKNISLGTVSFGYYAERIHPISNVNSYKNELTSGINSLTADGTTNIGDAIRVADVMLKENKNTDKTIIMLTDGEPTGYSTSTTGWVTYYLGDAFRTSSYRPYYINTSNDYTRGMDYVNQVIDNRITKDSVNSFITVGLDQSSSEKTKVQSIVSKLSGILGNDLKGNPRSVYYSATSQGDLESLYNKFATEIKENLERSLEFQESYDSEKLEPVNLPAGFTAQNGLVKGTLKVNYKLSGDNYVPDPVNFNLQFKAKNNGMAIFGKSGTSTVKFSDEQVSKSFLEDTVYIGEGVNTTIELKVKDQRGTQATYSNIPMKQNEFKENSPAISLKKDPKLEISVKAQDVNKMEYQFIKSNQKPTTNIEAIGSPWKEFLLEENVVNPDIDINNPGKLSHRGYDVNHMPGTDSGYTVAQANEYWVKPELTFKYPWTAISQESAAYASTPSEYGTKESYLEDGQTKYRWKKNMLFLNNMYIGEYKEAAKMWGYIKPTSTGYYNFGTVSDDGVKGQITVKGATSVYSDLMTLHGTTFDSKNTVVYLEAGKYYPVYLQYFNWGGGAEFRMVYGYSATNSSVGVTKNSSNVPSEWFYPSFTTTPGEYADAVFTGNGGVDFDVTQGTGDYYVAYRASYVDGQGNKTVKSSGYYGPFTVLGTSTVKVERSIDQEVSSLVVGKPFNMTYKIDVEIPANQYLRGLSQVNLKEVKLSDYVPSNLQFISGEQTSENITIQLDNIVLTEVDGVFKGTLEKTVQLKPIVAGNYVVGKQGNSYISYLDADEETRGYSDIAPSELVVKTDVIMEVKNHKALNVSGDSASFSDLAKIFPMGSINVGVLLEVKDNSFDREDKSNQLTLAVSSGGKISSKLPIYIYPYSNGQIDRNNKIAVTLGTDGKLKFESAVQNREYMMVYQVDSTDVQGIEKIDSILTGTDKIIPKELNSVLSIQIVNNLPDID